MNWVRNMSVVSIRAITQKSAEVPSTKALPRAAAAPASERTSRNTAQIVLKPASASGSRAAHSFTPNTESEAATAQ